MNTSLIIWNKDISNKSDKEVIARKIANYARDGDVIGVGSGSTAYLALLALVDSGKIFTVHSTSYEIDYLCMMHDIPTTGQAVDWCFDGADEVDPEGNMIKGRGGAMLREKRVMLACHGPRFILIDPSKKVSRLGEKYPIPLEVKAHKIFEIETALNDMGIDDVTLRLAHHKDGPVITESGHVILDIKTTLNDEKRLMAIDGVVETGLFMGFNPTLVLPETKLERI